MRSYFLDEGVVVLPLWLQTHLKHTKAKTYRYLRLKQRKLSLSLMLTELNQKTKLRFRSQIWILDIKHVLYSSALPRWSGAVRTGSVHPSHYQIIWADLQDWPSSPPHFSSDGTPVVWAWAERSSDNQRELGVELLLLHAERNQQRWVNIWSGSFWTHKCL